MSGQSRPAVYCLINSTSALRHGAVPTDGPPAARHRQGEASVEHARTKRRAWRRASLLPYCELLLLLLLAFCALLETYQPAAGRTDPAGAVGMCEAAVPNMMPQ